ncbi:MAG: glycosyl transferase family 1 [Flavobacteriaceae bacterium]|nr:glycosyl transferase family 1 [Flavobacteriaceae bacterium]
MNKKVLIVTYYWPPAGGPGVQRWLKFVKYLPEFNIQPQVFIPENPSYPIVDDSLSREVLKRVKIHKKKIIEPYALANLMAKKSTEKFSSGIITESKKQTKLQQLMLYVRGNYFIPDARKFWVGPSINEIKKILQKEQINTLITTGPPHSLHLIGLGLKKEFSNLHWIADFRDPWTSISYHEELKLNEQSKQKHQDLETSVLKSADQLVVTSFSTQLEFQSKTKQPVHLITNGYDERPYMETPELDEHFTFSHIGSLMKDRNPIHLWKIFNDLIQENKDFESFFELDLIGKTASNVIDSIQENGLESYLRTTDYLPHEEALKKQEGAQVLLLIEKNQPQTKGIIPAKLFEYMSAQRPILAIGPKDWDVCKILEQTNAGVCFDYEDQEGIKRYIKELFSAFLKGKLKVSSKGIEDYSRKKLTEKLASIIPQ